MGEFIQAFEKSIFSPLKDSIEDYIEIGFDYLLDNEIIKQIPVVKTIVSICKVGLNIQEKNFVKQTISFINGFNSGYISKEELEEHKKILENDPQIKEKELTTIIVILNSTIDYEQSKILGCFYNAYINKKISWERFSELSEANKRMFTTDYKILIEAGKNKGIKIGGRELYQAERLISLGLLQFKNRLGGLSWGDIARKEDAEIDIVITSFGELFYNCSLLNEV